MYHEESSHKLQQQRRGTVCPPQQQRRGTRGTDCPPQRSSYIFSSVGVIDGITSQKRSSVMESGQFSNSNPATCYESWANDRYNSEIIDRVTDVNAWRTNMYVGRPEEVGLGRGCSGFNYRKNGNLVDENNLQDYCLESQLATRHIPTNNDWIEVNKDPDTLPVAKCTSQTVPTVRAIWLRESGKTTPIYPFDDLTFRSTTSARHLTLDQRLLFIPPDLC